MLLKINLIFIVIQTNDISFLFEQILYCFIVFRHFSRAEDLSNRLLWVEFTGKKLPDDVIARLEELREKEAGHPTEAIAQALRAHFAWKSGDDDYVEGSAAR